MKLTKKNESLKKDLKFFLYVCDFTINIFLC